jgi:hypothetical protein
MTPMWRVVCTGQGALRRRIVDRGPMHAEKARAEGFAKFLGETGLYESVELVSSQTSAGTEIAGQRAKAADTSATGPSMDELSKLFD